MIRPVALLPEPPLPLLVTGVTGVAGYNAFRYFRARYPGQVLAIRQVSNWPLQGEGIVACDAEDHKGLARLIDRHRVAAVLYCAGNCALKSCELDPSMAWRINLSALRSLLQAAPCHPVRWVYLSIDLVFSGTGQGGHVEEDLTDPVTVYGRTMAAAEQMLRLACPQACILRISLPMGISLSGHAGAIDWIQSRFKQSKPATLYYDEIRTPTYTDCLNRLCHVMLSNDLCGLYHAGGPRKLSLYEIAQIVNRVGGYDPRHLMGCYRHEAGPIPPRAGNVTMDSTKLRKALGYEPFDPWPLDDGFVPTHRDWHRERSGQPTGSPTLLAELLYRNRTRPSSHPASRGAR
jgi:dTDP-4-dehydrorhamnose reductase